MMRQTRWYCHACGIEWIYATAECGTGCPNPACHSDQIERVTYTTTSPVGDMPRDRSRPPVVVTPIEARPEPRSMALIEADEDLWAVPV